MTKAPDGEDGPVNGEGRNNGVDARPVGQAGVDHGGRLIHAPAHGGDNPFDDLHQVGVVLEDHVGLFEQSGPLHVDVLAGVHQDVTDGGVLEQRFQRAQPEDLIQDFARQLLPLDAAQRGVQASHEVLNDGENLAARGAVSQGHDLLEIYPAQQIAVDRGLELLICFR